MTKPNDKILIKLASSFDQTVNAVSSELGNVVTNNTYDVVNNSTDKKRIKSGANILANTVLAPASLGANAALSTGKLLSSGANAAVTGAKYAAKNSGADAVGNAALSTGKLLSSGANAVGNAVYNKAKSVGRKAVNATTGISLAKRLRKKLNVVLDATDADYVHEVKITGIVVGGKAYNLVGKFTLNDTLGAAKELSTLIKNGDTSKNADKTVPDDNILKDFLTKSNTLLASIVKKQ